MVYVSSLDNRSSLKQQLQELLPKDHLVTFSPEELEILIKAAQLGDPTAKESLYQGFLLLLYDLCTEPLIVSFLGEDALSIALEEFFLLLQSYKGPDYASFPGIVKLRIRSRLYRIVNKQEKQQKLQLSYEQYREKGQDIPDSRDSIAAMLELQAYQSSLEQLTPEELEILYRTIFQDIPLKEQALQQGTSLRTLQRKYQRAIQHLQRLMLPTHTLS